VEFPVGWGGWGCKPRKLYSIEGLHVWNKMFLEKTHVEHYIIAVVVLVDDDVIVINDITVNWSISKCSFFFFTVATNMH